MMEHVARLSKGNHVNQRLQNAWNHYGADNFVIELLIVCRRADLETYEQIAIDGFGAYYATGGGYNLRPFAFVNKGRPGSEKQKQVTRERLVGVKNPKLSKMLLEPNRQQESRRKLDSLRVDPEIEQRRAAAIRAAYADPAKRAAQASLVRGIKRSPETIEKCRKAALAREFRKKQQGYVLPRGADGRIISLGALTGQQ
jgi:hypothetical protein